MGFFNKNNNKKLTGRGRHEEVDLQKKIISANYTPIDYQHTATFARYIANPLDDERKTVKPMNLDAYNKGWRDTAIQADSKLEISCGKTQFINHMSVIKKIIDLQKGEIKRAQEIKEKLKTDLEECVSEIDRINAIQDLA